MLHKNKRSSKFSAPNEAKSEWLDDSIQETNSSSIVSKRSVERLYYPDEPHYFGYFVKKPRRRSPLINRGYWLRMKAIDHVVRKFLEKSTEKKKVVINLGCGYDPLPWQCLSRYSSACEGTKFIDIDYSKLLLKKRDIVKITPELESPLTNVDYSSMGDILFRSDQYLQLGCDLRNLPQLEETLASVIDLQNCSILFTAEVSITYMNLKTADALINWASTLPKAKFCLLEQIMPEGIEHPFAKTMMAHFDKIHTPLGSIRSYPTTHAQEKRFIDLGWSNVTARNLWELWGAPDFLTPEDRSSLDIEPFDEWEEFAVFGCHYFLLVADNSSVSCNSQALDKYQANVETNGVATEITSLQATLTFCESPKDKGLRRFGSAFAFRDSSSTTHAIGVFGGMGASSRTATCDSYVPSTARDINIGTGEWPSSPSARMCHTMTDMGDLGALLIGGRTGPDNSLADCFIYHKWLNIWERVQDLPKGQYRHSAVYLGHGRVLVCPGKHNSRDISSDYLVWSRKLGWKVCKQTGNPTITYGATFCLCDDSTSPVSRNGILAGGISKEAILQDTVWQWTIHDFTGETPLIIFEKGPNSISPSASIARFGATATLHNKQVFVVGGIMRDQLLNALNEVCCFPMNEWTGKVSPVAVSSTFRPLLVGSSVMSINNTLLIIGGSAVCFSFGTFWNNGIFTIDLLDSLKDNWNSRTSTIDWGFSGTIGPAISPEAKIPASIPTPLTS